MTDTPAVPTEPAENDVKIWEHCDPPWSLVVIGWDVSAGSDCPMKPYKTEEEAYKAAREFAKDRGRNVWVVKTGRILRLPPRLLERHRPPT